MAKINITNTGRAVATSGLLPETAKYFLDYFSDRGEILGQLLPRQISPGDPSKELTDQDIENDSNLAFVLCTLCLSSPEYGDGTLPARRFLPYMIDGNLESARANRLKDFMPTDFSQYDAAAANSSDILVDWSKGIPLSILEDRFDKLRGGLICGLADTTASHLEGMANILFSLTGTEDPKIPPPLSNLINQHRSLFIRLIRRIRQLAHCIRAGVPEEMLWMTEVVDETGHQIIGRNLILRLKNTEFVSIESVLDSEKKRQLDDEFRDAEGNAKNANVFVSAVKQTRKRTTTHRRNSQKRRARNCHAIIDDYYNLLGKDFESVLEGIFNCVGICILDRDDGSKVGFPDFVVEVFKDQKIVIECKSTQSPKNYGVSLREVRDVSGKAETHGFSDWPLITVCQPYVAPNVPRLIEAATRLTAINAEDFAEALLQYHQNKIDESQLVAWMTTPGQAKAMDLPK